MTEVAESPSTRWIYAPETIIVSGCLIALIAFGVRATSGLVLSV